MGVGLLLCLHKKHNLWYRITGTCVLLAAHYEHAWFPSASNNSRVIFFSIIYLLTYMGVFGFEVFFDLAKQIPKIHK